MSADFPCDVAVNEGHGEPAFSHARFETTPWSTVRRAQGKSPEAGAALEKLCRIYWAPVYAYTRRRGYAYTDAEDLTQGFFVSLLERGFWQRTDRSQGRFRGYLVGALRMFLSDERDRAHAWKRGGHAEWMSMDELLSIEGELDRAAGSAPTDPADIFDHRWAQTLVTRAMQRLQGEQETAGRSREFHELQRFLAETPGRGDYERAAAALDTNRTTVAVRTHRLRRRLSELVHLEVADTVSDPSLVKDEMRHILRALGGGSTGAR